MWSIETKSDSNARLIVIDIWISSHSWSYCQLYHLECFCLSTQIDYNYCQNQNDCKTETAMLSITANNDQATYTYSMHIITGDQAEIKLHLVFYALPGFVCGRF